MTDTLTDVVSTQTLGGLCAREYLGYPCIAGTGYACTCTDVRSASVEVVTDSKGAPVLALSLELFPGILDTKPLVRALHLTGYRADWTRLSNGGLDRGVTVQVSYELNRQENRALREHVEKAL